MPEVHIGSRYEETAHFTIHEVAQFIEHEAIAAFAAAQSEGWVPAAATLTVECAPSLLGYRIDIHVDAPSAWVHEVDLFGDGVQSSDAARLRDQLAAVRDQYQRDASDPDTGHYDRRFYGGVAIWDGIRTKTAPPPVSAARQEGKTHDTKARAAMIAMIASASTLRLMDAHAHGLAALDTATDAEHTAINFMLTLVEGALVDRGIRVCVECGLLRGLHTEECPRR